MKALAKELIDNGNDNEFSGMDEASLIQLFENKTNNLISNNYNGGQ